MSAISYAHYNFQTVYSEEQFNELYNEYDADPYLNLAISEKTITVVRDLEIFETISVFFELLLESIKTYFVAESIELAEQRNEAWELLYNREWVRIIALEKEPLLFGLPEVNMFPEFPLELTSLIMADFTIPMLGLTSQVCKRWQVVCGQDNLWEKFFPYYKFPEGITIKEYCGTHYVNSDDQLHERVVSFIDSFKANQVKILRFYPCASGDVVAEKIDSFISLRCNLLDGWGTARLAPYRTYEKVLFISNIYLENKPPEWPVFEDCGNFKKCTFSNIPKVLSESYLDYYIIQHCMSL